ncbi:GAF domain-like protein [Microdochium trichocladiopsis]|uniref:GAF domain-like protein n=1 Tax=Microdochium trichocladiopsis TaxID=1682393 RepID=A0A9P8XZY2_9PEZI|nr:GAF domain-like protein [Microdochium trichocladiopsis]KAH7025970.1 GAF domain-like protein [Microdochium trichocladiopsis]
MVHADASNFASGVTKQEAYEQVLLQAEGLFDGQRNWVCNLSNTASLLWHAYHSLSGPSNEVNWAGFYTLDPKHNTSNKANGHTNGRTVTKQQQQLVLGPFQGKVACQTILFGRGVCGTAAATQETQLVHDVDLFPGHIACDGDSRSEIVVPVLVEDLEVQGGEDGGAEIKKKKVVAIIDIDCAVVGGFDEVDRKYLEELAELLGRSCDW